MRVLVTGGAGFIGSHVVDLLNKKQHEVMIIDDLSTGKMEWIDPIIKKFRRVNFDMCQVQNRDHVEPIMRGFKPEVICHLAAQPAISTSWDDPVLNAKINEIGTLNLLLAAREYGVKRFIFTSTSAVYKECNGVLTESSLCIPVSPYGISKLAAEHYVRAIMPNSVILRLGNVYGPRQVPIGENQIVPRALLHFLCGQNFSINGDGEQKRDYVFVEDVAEAFLMAMWGSASTYNIASGVRTSVNQLLGLIEAVYSVKGYKWNHNDQQDPRRDVNMCILAAYEGLGWKPQHSLVDGLHITAEWWNDRKN